MQGAGDAASGAETVQSAGDAVGAASGPAGIKEAPSTAVLFEALRLRLAAEGRICIRSSGRSMLPLIRSGDLIEIEGAVSYRPGDVVVFQRGSLLVAHRIICEQGDELIIMGDNAPTHADYIRAQDILGRATRIGCAMQPLSEQTIASRCAVFTGRLTYRAGLIRLRPRILSRALIHAVYLPCFLLSLRQAGRGRA